MWLLDVNNILLRVISDSTAMYEEPGIAYVTDSNTVFGHEALAQLFISPVHCQTSYWQRMNEDAIEPPTRHIGKHSDLVYNQVVKAFSDGKVADNGWVVVPSDFDSEQIGLLFGILEYQHLHPRGFVDRAIVASPHANDVSNAFFIDLHLERTVVTRLNNTNGCMEAVDFKTIASTGYLQLVKRWIDTVAQRSLDETRFDPRISGETEQQVFDRLRERINGSNEMIVSVEHNGETRSTNVRRDDLIENCIDIYERIAATCDAESLVLLGEHANCIPGLRAFIENSGRRVEVCPASNTIAAAVQVNAQTPASADVELHKSFRYTSDLPRAPSTYKRPLNELPTPDALAHIPTHVLQNHIAYPIGSSHVISHENEAICTLKQLDGALALEPYPDLPILLNDTLIDSRTTVSSGDRIKYGSDAAKAQEFVLIHVFDHG